MVLETVEYVCEFHTSSFIAVNRSFLGLNQASCKVFFEPLKIHDLFFDRVLHNEPVDTDLPSLADSVSSVNSLKILHRIPFMLCKDDGVCSSESKS